MKDKLSKKNFVVAKWVTSRASVLETGCCIPIFCGGQS